MELRELDIQELIHDEYKTYSKYVVEERAIPSIVDGLKPVQRRSLWMGQKYAKSEWMKVTKLAGNTMAIHPHGSTAIEDTISNMAQSFTGSNNIAYFENLFHHC